MQTKNNKLVIGFITYGNATAKYLPYFLPSLKAQSFSDYQLVVIDNTEIQQNENQEYITKNYPEIELVWPGENLGFAKAYNLMINQAIALGAEYFLVINPDVKLRVDAVEQLVAALEAEPELGSVSPKILKWDFENKKETNIIDGCGIVMRPSLQFFDLGQGQLDTGQYDQTQILGPSGAAGLYRLAALKDVQEGSQYFEERFFMYKEDCDLNLRLFLKNYKSKLVRTAIMYHDRTAEGQGEKLLSRIKSRQNKSRQIKIWSFVNQQLLYYKYWRTIKLVDKLRLMRQQCALLFYIILLEPYLLLYLPQIAIKRRGIKFYG